MQNIYQKNIQYFIKIFNWTFCTSAFITQIYTFKKKTYRNVIDCNHAVSLVTRFQTTYPRKRRRKVMKFKTYLSKEGSFRLGVVSCVDWSGAEEIYSCSSDHNLLKWKANTRESVQVASLPEDFHPTDLHLLVLKTNVGGGGKGSDSLLIASNDGRFIILNKSARLERSISAHAGAITSARWSPDGAGLLTG